MIKIKQAMQDYGISYKKLLRLCQEKKIIASLSCEGVRTWYINKCSLEKYLTGGRMMNDDRNISSAKS